MPVETLSAGKGLPLVPPPLPHASGRCASIDYQLFRAQIARGPLRLLFTYELPRATQVVVPAQFQLQQQMLQRRNPSRHLRQHNIDPLRQLVQPEAESGFRTVLRRSLRRAPAGSASSHRTPSLLLNRHRIPPGYRHLYASAVNRPSTIFDGEGRVAVPALRGRLKNGDFSLRPPEPDTPFSKRIFLSDSYSFQKGTMALERREPFTPTVSFPGGRNVRCF